MYVNKGYKTIHQQYTAYVDNLWISLLSQGRNGRQI